MYLFAAGAFAFLGAPWWFYVLFIVCDLIDDSVYDSHMQDEDEEAECSAKE